MSINRRDVVYLLVAMIAFIFQIVLANCSNNDTGIISIGICMMLVVFIIASFSIYKNFTLISLQFFTLFGIGIFNVGKFVQFLFDPTVLYDHEDLTHFSFNGKNIFVAIQAISLFIICIWITYLLTSKNKQKNYKKEYNSFFFKIGALSMITSTPFYLYRLYLEYLSYKALGYGSIYATGGISNGNFFVRISYTVFLLGYMLICSSETTYRSFCGYSGLMLFTNVIAMMKGSRSEIIITIMFFLWFSTTYYEKKYKFKKLFMIVIPMIFLLQVISQVRLGRRIELKGGFFDLIFSQSVSAYVLLAFIQSSSRMLPHTYPYVLDPIVNTFRLIFNPVDIRGQSIAVIQHRFDLGHQITFYLNPIYYLNGFSIGSNAIAELWEFKWIGISIGAVCMGIFISFINKKKQSSFFMFLSYIIVQYVAMCFRGNFIIGLYDILKYGFVYLILSTILGIAGGKNNA